MECFYDWILIDTRLLLILFLLTYDNQVLEFQTNPVHARNQRKYSSAS